MKLKPQMMKMRWLSAAVMLSLCTSSAWAFSIDDVAKQAKALAGKGYEAPKSNLPSAFRDMKYADYQQIQFNHDKAYWNNQKTPFKLEFYHQGMYFDTPVTINEVTASSVRKIKYNPDYFNFGSVQHDKDTVKDLGFAGFKVLYPINSKDKNDEIVSMLGASYFRVLGQGQVYGLSARGLAIDTALPSGEEFPRFREFWIEHPKATDKRLTIYALLDSPRATGAYRFVIMPGRDTVVDVQSKVYLRDKVGKLGVAPLTSMFLFTKGAANMFIAQKTGGAIVNVCSTFAVVGSPGYVAYHASKGGVASFTRAAAISLMPHNIRVNAVGPGTTETPGLHDGARDTGDEAKGMASFLALQPLKRFGKPEEIASVIAFLASDEASFVTGALWMADGGYTIV